MKDLKTKIKTVALTVGTTIVDRQGYESLTFSVNADDGTVVAVTHGDDSGLSDSAVVGSDFIIGKLTFATADGSPVTLGYNGNKRYVLITYSTPPDSPGGQAILGHPHLSPTGQAG